MLRADPGQSCVCRDTVDHLSGRLSVPQTAGAISKQNHSAGLLQRSVTEQEHFSLQERTST